ncbi:LysR family transcriptional regulator [Paenibacillus sp. Lou8.1]|uniref:LysR family transcriptional regulator n=1 Tax=unclassified Paenibacillus TaxID=185978 RepID=UPI0020B82AD0|nr:LysR family transcriptional regulator [Paenibacillus sp. Lou8.1]MCP3805730.1 LysR family transcriptional regulator [Paenibacillus sp. Lou8.1]
MNILKLRILMLIDKFHKATDVAEALQVKQPTVSFHMKSLEKEMGVSLFSLQQGRIMLTEAGKKLLPYAKQIISLEQEARQAVDELTEESQGQLHLSAESISGTYLLPTLMAKFAERYPDCRIQLEIQSPDAIKQLLKQGEIDFAFLDDRDSLPEYTVAEPVASDQVGVIRSASAYKLGEVDGPDMLDKHTWVKYSGSSVVDQYSSLVKPHLEINSWEAVKQVVSGGEALAFFPASGVDNNENAAPSVEWLPYPEADNQRSHYQINIVYQQDTHMNLMQQAFLDFIRREGLEMKS